MSKEQFLKIDKMAVLDFASTCRNAGVSHFELLSSVGVSSASSSFYLRAKGELEDGLKELGFDRLSLFHPSMIMTPKNRYGFSQAVALSVMPLIDPLLFGSLNKFRSISSARLGSAIAMNVINASPVVGTEILHWHDFMVLSNE